MSAAPASQTNAAKAPAVDAPRWRPLGQADADWLGERADAALRAWQDEWLDAGDLRVQQARTFAAGAAPSAGGACWRAGAQLAAHTEPDAWKRHALAALALPAQADAVPVELLAPVQEHLLDALFARLAATLLEGASAREAAFARAAPGAAAGFDAGGVHLRIGGARDPQLLDLFCAAELAWLRPLAAAPADTQRAAPAARQAALGASEVRLSALLGRCELTALQLSELAVGDVLTTAQSLHEPIPLRLHADGAAPRIIAHGRPGRAQQRLSIQLTALQPK